MNFFIFGTFKRKFNKYSVTAFTVTKAHLRPKCLSAVLYSVVAERIPGISCKTVGLKARHAPLRKIIKYGLNLAKNEEKPFSTCLQPISSLYCIYRIPVPPIVQYFHNLLTQKLQNDFSKKKFNFKCVFGWLHDYLKARPKRLKSLRFGAAPFEFFFQKTLILAFEANSAIAPFCRFFL